MEIKNRMKNGIAVKKQEMKMAESTKGQTEEPGYERRGVEYAAISRDGDTLEISKGRGIGELPDAILAKYSKQKLKQLLINRQITRQQYDKAMKNK